MSEFNHISAKCLLLLIFALCTCHCKQAYSQAYFQQEVNFKIAVTLNDKQQMLHAFEEVEYINNSPDTLNLLYFHLWPNAYANNRTALARQLLRHNGKQKLFNEPALKGKIDSLDFKSEGTALRWQMLNDSTDICRVFPQKPLLPGDTVNITTPFRVKIPKGVSSRLGYNGESFQISQWFPKPAVYDADGWHLMPYLDMGEFFGEFGSYEVSITLPENYTIAASAELQNKEELDRLDQLATDTTWKSYPYFRRWHFPPSSDQLKTLHYKGINIHDFAWFADKRFHVVKGSIILPQSQREVVVWVMFTDQQAILWKDALAYASRSIMHLSEWIGDYPYNTFTVVQSALSAGAGMEYPGLAVIGSASDAYSLDEVIAHEAAHNWFYSALGSNERRYPFMDESIAAAYEMRYMRKFYPNMKLWEVYYKNPKLARFFRIDHMPVQMMQQLEWLLQARSNNEQPISLHSDDYTYHNYSAMIYNKGGVGFNYLRSYLGDSLFDQAMQTYFSLWKFKHPQPDDLRDVFEMATDKDLDWFFDDFLKTTKRLDYKALRLNDNRLLVDNKGQMTSPLHIAGMEGDSMHFEKWISGFSGKRWIDLPRGDYNKLVIDPLHRTPELFRLNNSIRTSGLLPRMERIREQLYFSIEDPTKRTLMYLPAINWSKANGLMLGVGLHNGLLLPKPLSFFFVPFYSFRNKDLAGQGKLSLNVFPIETFLRQATISLEAARFAFNSSRNYHLLKLGLTLHMRKKQAVNQFNSTMFGYLIAASDLFRIEQIKKNKMLGFLQLGYRLEKSSLINPYRVVTTFEYQATYQKVNIELNYRISYNGHDRGLDMRLFAGTMLKRNQEVPFYSLSASGRSGRELYLYEGFYLDRFSEFPTTFWSRQTTFGEGGLVSPVNDSLGYSNWLVSLGFVSNLPGRASRLPVKPFVNVLLNEKGLKSGNQSPVFYEAGLKAGFWGLLEIYVPLIISGNIDQSTHGFKNRIRLVFSLNILQNQKLSSGIFD